MRSKLLSLGKTSDLQRLHDRCLDWLDDRAVHVGSTCAKSNNWPDWYSSADDLGRIVSTSNNPRLIQFAIKLNF